MDGRGVPLSIVVTGANAGRYPHGRLVYNSDRSAFFGVTASGGAAGHGTVFEFSSGGFLKFVDFKSGAGSGPTPLELGKDGKTFYGCMSITLRKSKVFSVGPNGNVRTIASFHGEAANWQPTLTPTKGGGMLVMDTRGRRAKAGGLFWVFDK